MDKKEKINQITEGVIWKQLLLFFFPILFGTLFQQVYNTEGITVQIPNLHNAFSLCFFAQQLQQLLRLHGQDRAVGRAGDGVCQRLLGLLQLHDLFFNGVLCNELIHLHRVLLTDAVGAVRRLILDRGIPPRIQMDHVVGRREVEPRAARLEADEKERHAAQAERFGA